MTVIKHPIDMVCSEWGSRPHVFRLDGGQVSHCNVVVGLGCVFLLMCSWVASDRMSFFCVNTSFH